MSIGFGGFLARLRTEKGLSLRQLGQLADIDHAYVHRLETGEKVDPSDDIVNSLIRGLRPGERKARILRFLVGQTIDNDLLDEVLEDTQRTQAGPSNQGEDGTWMNPRSS